MIIPALFFIFAPGAGGNRDGALKLGVSLKQFLNDGGLAAAGRGGEDDQEGLGNFSWKRHLGQKAIPHFESARGFFPAPP